MQRVKQASKKKHVTKSVPVLGAAGLTFSMVGGASAAAVPTPDAAQSPTVGLGHQVTLGDEEIADEIRAQGECVDEKPDQLLNFRTVAVGDRAADDNIVLRCVTVQQRHEGTE